MFAAVCRLSVFTFEFLPSVNIQIHWYIGILHSTLKPNNFYRYFVGSCIIEDIKIVLEEE